MKIKKILFVLGILVLTACSAKPASKSPSQKAATNTPNPLATVTNTPVPLGTPTTTLTPAPGVPDFYRGMASTIDQFSPVERTDILRILIYLRSQPSLLAAGAQPAVPSSVITGAGGNDRFTLTCSQNGVVSCAAAASIKINDDQGNPLYLVIWEVKNKDGTSGFIVDDVLLVSGREADLLKKLAAESTNLQKLEFIYSIASKYENQNPFISNLFTQQGYKGAIDEWISSGNVPAEMDSFILLSNWQRSK